MTKNLTSFGGVVSVAAPHRSVVVYSLLAVLTTCHAFDAFFLNTPTLGAMSDRRAKRDAPIPKLRDFEGELDFLTSLELQHGMEFASNHSSPKYMLDLYGSMETGENLVHPSAEEKAAIVESDTVRSFAATVVESNSTSETNFTRKWLANFRVTSVSELEERVRLAELRILLNRSWRKFTLEVALHHWAPAPCPHDPTLFECLQKQLLMSRLLPTYRHDDYDGREVFDVTEGLRHWFTESPTWRGEYELEIRTVHSVQNPEDSAATDTLDDSSSYSFSSSVEDSTLDESAASPSALDDVVLVVFSRALHPVSITLDAAGSVKVRTPRSSKSSRKDKKPKKSTSAAREEQERLVQEKLLRELFASKEETGPCRRVPMDVDFYNNGWARWIVYPKRFDAYRCAGRCTGPLGSKDNPSNHAIMQNMVRASRPDRAPEPCCIPTKLSPLSMIYLEHGNIVMKHHEDMIVEECGCR
ncbi:nodal homolog [Patiria miniata]|uniref:TGF-beta family profile domain-containing protein n=3 Tax=Patiria TaxID=35076 RepID=A0A914AC56_PATMI|nr:nodal homolog [Patiria miniata]